MTEEVTNFIRIFLMGNDIVSLSKDRYEDMLEYVERMREMNHNS